MKSFIYSIIIFLSLHFSLKAQQSDSVKTTLSDVVITATKTPTPFYELGSSVSVITSQEIARQQLQTVVDVLREEPGLSIIQQGGPAKLSNVFIRGGNPNHTLVIVDGVKMNDASSPNNAFDFSTLNTNDIDRIEIVRGPQSTLYGSDAVAGIINIITKQGINKPRFSLMGETGSNGYYRGNFSALGTIDVLNYSFNFTRNGSEGIPASDAKFGNKINNGYNLSALNSLLSYNIEQFLKFDLNYKYTKSFSSLDQDAKLGDDPNFTYNVEEQVFRAGVKSNLFDNNLQSQFYASLIRRTTRNLDLVDQYHPNLSSDSYNYSQRIKFDWQNTAHFIKNNLITFGIETETEEANTTYFSTSDYGPYDSIFPHQSNRTTGLYLQDQVNIENKFFISAGMRYDDNQKFGGVTTFRIAPAYFINSLGAKLKMSYGTGFKAPSLFYLFDPTWGNPDLKPETSKGCDAGLEKYFAGGNISVGLTYFNILFEDMFGYDANYKEVNIAKASSHGFEVTASAQNLDNFSFTGNYTFTETKDESESSSDFGLPLIRRPKHQASLIINYNFNKEFNFNLQVQYVGARDDKDFSTFPVSRVMMPDYTLVNFAASYQLLSYLEFTGRIENLFDKQYEEVLYYGTLGRSIYAGVNVMF